MPTALTRRSLASATAGLALGGLAAPAGAAERAWRWRNVVVGGGGFIPGIVFSRAERGLAYARSDMGGAYRFDAAAGRWIPLQDDNPVSSYMGVESLAPDPVNPDVVHAAVGMSRGEPAAMLRSDNRGATWRVTPVDFRMGGNEDGRGLGERLAVDPNATDILYFGSRHDGLQRSTDGGRSWGRVDSFPVRGAGLRPGGPTHPGVAFVVIDPRGERGAPSRILWAGVADEAGRGLYRSTDAGRSWTRVTDAPSGLSPVKAALADDGVLYSCWCEGVGPNGVTDGAVWRHAPDGAGRDISPPRPGGDRAGGFMGVAVDHTRPGTLLVSTLNRWSPGDTLWRSTDDGASWTSLRERSVHDVEATPFLYWGNDRPDFGWWMAAVALDPFDGERAVYATGATVYATRNLSADAPLWRPWVEGIEQTAVITLVSPPGDGPPLLTGFGDISGFAHTDLSASPRDQFRTPVFGNTNRIDYAGLAPHIVVRSGTPHEGVGSEGHDGATLALSRDGGLTWTSLGRPRPADGQPRMDGRIDLYRDAPITVSADGRTLVLMTPQPVWSYDQGRSWRPCLGLPERLHPVADRVDPLLFYALDFDTGGWFVSTDGACRFVQVDSRGLPASLAADRPTSREAPWPLRATPGRAGELWLVSGDGLFHSRDGGLTFARVDTGGVQVQRLDLAPAGQDGAPPPLYAIARRDGVLGVYGSVDGGRRWRRLNGPDAEWGRRFRAIAADQRRPGRVYVATDGRGVFVGDPEESA
jgi:xyloglucan-specific exo-beta-1,4-glucanase